MAIYDGETLLGGGVYLGENSLFPKSLILQLFFKLFGLRQFRMKGEGSHL